MRHLFTLLSVFIFSTSFSQKNEFRFALNSGLFHFVGPAVESSSLITWDDRNNFSSYTDNPYGSQNGPCIGVSVNFQQVSKGGFIRGIDVGFELLKSKIQINGVSGFDNNSKNYTYPAEGSTFLKYGFMTAHPFLGYRIATKKINYDLTGGFDLGFCLFAEENGKATAANGVEYETSGDRRTISWDFRPRIQIGAQYERFGVYLGFSAGVSNYLFEWKSFFGHMDECYSRLFRFGITYMMV